MKKSIDSGAIKYILGFLVVFAIRLLPFRPPNVEPIMATMMPFAKGYGALGGFLFATLSIVLFDLFTMRIGMWTLITALAYGLIGVGAYYFLRNRESSIKNYVVFAVVGTLFYDAVTGLTIGPLFWGQPFMAALVGQIPFTLAHLAGNIVFSVVVSPLLYKHIVANDKLAVSAIFRPLQTQ